ncbi:MAG: cardiolipin synthase [Methanomicrobiales archaeon]|nr:cardiolipin synthase [Methanomicrobiales archaeon]
MAFYDLLVQLYDFLLPIVIIADIFFAVTVVFVRKKTPTSAVAWLLVLLLLPFIGCFLFLVFGQSFRKEKRFLLKHETDQQLRERMVSQIQEVKTRAEKLGNQWSGAYHRMALLLLQNNRALITTNNQITPYIDGKAKFADLIEAIKNARDHVHMEYFILKDDGLGRDIMKALTERARAGVEVRLLVDGVGSGGLPRHFYHELTAAGGKHAVFFPFLISYFNYRVNFRNHRKIAVIDGETAFIGGFNIGDDYLGLDKKWGYWRDTAVRIRGTGALDAQIRFSLDWNFASQDKMEVTERYFHESPLPKGSLIQIVSGGPDTAWNPVKESYLKMITTAVETVYIQTPYFIPDESVMDALHIAAQSGIDVRIMIPSKPDHLFVYWASHSYIEELLDSGVRAYTYENGFLHAKTIVIDGLAASVGSANWDNRSFKLNFETNAVIYDEHVAGELKQAYLNDLSHCTELTPEWYASRSRFFRVRSSLSRLFSPIL